MTSGGLSSRHDPHCLRVRVDNERNPARVLGGDGKMKGEGGLSRPAFLTDDCDCRHV